MNLGQRQVFCFLGIVQSKKNSALLIYHKRREQSKIMWIDNINFSPINPQSGLIGFASVNLFFNSDESVYIGSIGVYTNRNKGGYRLTYPTRKSHGKQITLAKPQNPKLAKKIKDAIIKEVQKYYLGDEDNDY